MSSRRNYLKMYTVIPAFQRYHISPSWWRLAFLPTLECSRGNNYIRIWHVLLCFCDRLWPFLFYMMLPHTGATVWVIICSVWIHRLTFSGLFCHPLKQNMRNHIHTVLFKMFYSFTLYVYMFTCVSKHRLPSQHSAIMGQKEGRVMIHPFTTRLVSHESAALALLSSWMKSKSLLFKIYSNTFLVQDLFESLHWWGWIWKIEFLCRSCARHVQSESRDFCWGSDVISYRETCLCVYLLFAVLFVDFVDFDIVLLPDFHHLS